MDNPMKVEDLLSRYKLIGLYGKSGVGKDLFTKLFLNSTLRLPAMYVIPGKQIFLDTPLKEDHINLLSNYSEWKHKKFGDIPKQAYANTFGYEREYLETREFKTKIVDKNGTTGVEHFIKYSEGLKKEFGEDIWVNALFRDYEEKVINGNEKWIISDLRFPIELDAITSKNNSLTVKIIREDSPYFGSKDGLLEDFSFQYIIENNGDKKHLLEMVKTFIVKNNLADWSIRRKKDINRLEKSTSPKSLIIYNTLKEREMLKLQTIKIENTDEKNN